MGKIGFSLILAILLLQAEAFISVFAQCTFSNPIKAAESPDPYVAYSGGNYYFLVTTGTVVIHKSTTLQDAGNAPGVTVWTNGGDIVSDIWAPELHNINGTWYIYACGSIGNGLNMRMFCLQANTNDPMGSYTYKGLIAGQLPAIDADVWVDPASGIEYITYSQFESQGQTIWIAQMNNPWTVGSKRVRISSPTYDWERKNNAGVVGARNVNEGPIFIKKNNKLHITYSASGCESQYYCLGLLTCSDGNYMNAGSWAKASSPVFQQYGANGVWGPGHNGFTKSPDGTEDWIIYHAKSTTNETNSDRSTRIQKFTWNSDDTPNFGVPVKTGVSITCPSSLSMVYPGDGTGLLKSLWSATLGGRTWFNDSICAQIDSVVDKDWGDTSPGCGIDKDFWNARWTGEIQALYSETYTFYLTINDIGRLWINNQQIIDQWTGSGLGNTFTGTIDLKAEEKVPIKLDFGKKLGDALIKLEWSSPSNPRGVVPQHRLFPSLITGINQIEEPSEMIKVYPNPSSGDFFVDAGNIRVKSLKITDSQDRLVYQINNQFMGKKKITNSGIAPGLYLLQLSGDDFILIKKMILKK